MAFIIMLIQFLGTSGSLLLGISAVGTHFQGGSEATREFAYAGIFLWAAALGVILVVFAIATITKKFSKAQS
ncbi:hypothetical protein A3709_19920 [Halioglobus sp. HI00S01]|nr:hypothetical protein A3709_19920 [Halioglobus sp. HI00S01]